MSGTKTQVLGTPNAFPVSSGKTPTTSGETQKGLVELLGIARGAFFDSFEFALETREIPWYTKRLDQGGGAREVVARAGFEPALRDPKSPSQPA